MNCQQCQAVLDDTLVTRTDDAARAALAEHAEGCDACAEELKSAERALASIDVSYSFRRSSGLRERILAAIAEADEPTPTASRSPWRKLLKPVVAVAAAASLLTAVALLDRLAPGPDAISPYALFVKACAAEELLFVGEAIVYLENRIVVKPVSDPVLAQGRWLPLVSLEASGKPRFDQLSLAAPVGEGYTVVDQAWCHPATGRFVRRLSVDGKPIFATSFDGKAVYQLETDAQGNAEVVRQPIGEEFRAPRNPAEVLGIGAGLRSSLSEDDATAAIDVVDAGEVTLDDGSLGRVLKVGYAKGDPEAARDAYLRYTIRQDDATIARIEFVAQDESLFEVRRVRRESVERPAVPWDLAGVAGRAEQAGPSSLPGILKNMLIPNVSVAHMVEKADFETYVFSPDPPWAGPRQIMDILDIASPPHRMFAIGHRAEDGRHVVLIESHSYNKMMAGALKKYGKVIYESPSGCKVISGPKDKWLAGILLGSARAMTFDPPSDDRTGYLLETPAGTLPALAVNGQLTDEELHALIDSLVPAKQCVEDDRR